MPCCFRKTGVRNTPCARSALIARPCVARRRPCTVRAATDSPRSRGTRPTWGGNKGCSAGLSVRTERLASCFEISRLGFDQVAERRDVDAHGGSSGDAGGSECEAPHAGVSRQLRCALPQQRGGLPAHLGCGGAEQVATRAQG